MKNETGGIAGQGIEGQRNSIKGREQGAAKRFSSRFLLPASGILRYSGGGSPEIIGAANVRFVRMLSIPFFSLVERSIPDTGDIPGIGRLSTGATWYKVYRAI